ncbi:MAG: outer membrane protein transport protein [Pseudomonadota bacterium]
MTYLRGAAACAALSVLCVDMASAGGFALRERSANAQGASFAGSTAAANDVTYSLFNPAALGKVETFELGGAISGIFPGVEGEPIGGGADVSPGVIGVLPSLAFGARVTEDLVLGIGVHSPFGLTTDYDDTFIGAADALRSELITIAVSGMAAYDIAPGFTVGVSGSVIYNDPQLTSATGVNADGSVQESKLNATEFTFAGSIGALWDVTDQTRLGVAVHSGYDIVTGGVLSTFTPTGAPVDLDGSASISLPLSISAGVRQELTDDLTLLAEFEWANWSEFSEIAVDVPALAPNNDIGEVTDYKDSIFVAVGAEYEWNENLTLRSGFAYDQTPTQRASRSARIPDADRIWASVGFSYALSDRMKIDAGYSAIFFMDTPLTIMNGPTAGTVLEYGGVTHILAIGGSVTF